MTGTTIHHEKPQHACISIEKPQVAHGPAIHRLVAACKPLDLNSRYAYLLLCEHFARTCVIARAGDEVVGFVSAYRPPRREDTVFVWQVAVAAQVRGMGIGFRMLQELLARADTLPCRYLETTVSPSNRPSRRLFRALARERAAPVHESVLFAESDFGEEDHECEMSIRIGPIPGK